MAGGKQTPRQRMINILYLVLLGLIALNVPESLLDSFKKIGDSLTTSTKNVQSGINSSYTAFDKHLKEEPTKAQPIYEKAQKATALATKLYNEVEDLKNQLVKQSGGFNADINDYAGRDNMEESERIMIKDGKGAILRKDINDTRDQLIALLDPKDRAGIVLSLDASDPIPGKGSPDKKSWEDAFFGPNIPVAAVMTTFIKIQSDAKNDEAAITKKLMSKFDQAQINLDQFSAVAVAPTSYVIVGQPYTAQVFLTAYDSHAKPEITVDGSSLPVENGQGKYTGNTSSEGIKTWEGSIKVRQADGTFKSYPIPKQTYQVAKPSAVVSPDKMNVLYIGVDNPLSVSAPGIPADKLHVSITSGSLSGSKGHFTAKVSNPGTAKIIISAEVAPGKTQTLSSSEFRIKRIPDPVARFAGISKGATSAVNIRAQDRVFAILDNFEFDAKFSVTRFTLFIQKPRQDFIIIKGTGNELNAQMKTAMQSITPGTKVLFDDITAVGPDGGVRGLQPIILTAN